MDLRFRPRHKLQGFWDGTWRDGLHRIQEHAKRRGGVDDHNGLKADRKRGEEEAGRLELRLQVPRVRHASNERPVEPRKVVHHRHPVLPRSRARLEKAFELHEMRSDQLLKRVCLQQLADDSYVSHHGDHSAVVTTARQDVDQASAQDLGDLSFLRVA
eukprot:1845888-Prymnesium_polylepis.2